MDGGFGGDRQAPWPGGRVGAEGPGAVTVRQALAWARDRLAAAGVADPAWDASLLLAWVLGTPRAGLFASDERTLTSEEAARFEQAVERRAGREPLQYITGTQGFMGLELAVNPHVLVPRPETEVLVESVLQFLQDLPGSGPLPVADLGTGSGAIAVALAAHEPRVRVAAVDLSPDALNVARTNAERCGVADRVEFLQGDLLEPLSVRRFAAIACNPPYLDPAEASSLMPEVADHEPALALFSPAGPLHFYRRLAESARAYLVPGGMLAVEAGIGQAAPVAALLAKAWGLRAATSAVMPHVAPVPPPGTVQVRRDYGGVDRVVLARLDDTTSGG